MAEIKIRKGKKSDKDVIVSVNGRDIDYNDFSKELQRLRDKHGEKKVREAVKLPDFKHRDVIPHDITLEEASKLAEIFYETEDKNYPPSQGKQGRKMLQQKLSRDLFRTRNRQ